MTEHPEWRVEKYADEMDPFMTIQWFVMQGSAVIAQCEVEAHAQRIVLEHQRHVHYLRVLEHISGLSADSHDLDTAVEAALRALEDLP